MAQKKEKRTANLGFYCQYHPLWKAHVSVLCIDESLKHTTCFSINNITWEFKEVTVEIQSLVDQKAHFSSCWRKTTYFSVSLLYKRHATTLFHQENYALNGYCMWVPLDSYKQKSKHPSPNTRRPFQQRPQIIHETSTRWRLMSYRLKKDSRIYDRSWSEAETKTTGKESQTAEGLDMHTC